MIIITIIYKYDNSFIHPYLNYLIFNKSIMLTNTFIHNHH